MNKILVNLPEGMVNDPKLTNIFNNLKASYEVEFTNYQTQEQFNDNMENVSGIVMWTFPEFDEDFFNSNKNLKIVAKLNSSKATIEAGLNSDSEVYITDYRHLWSPTVSELAMTFTLTGLRKVSQLHIDSRQGKEYWVKNISTDMPASHKSLFNKKVAIVGYGKIGQIYRSMLHPFNCEVHAYDPYLPKEIFEQQELSEIKDINDIDNTYDVVMCCAANTKETEGLVSESVINNLADDVIFINVGRAHLLDNRALTNRLQKNEMYAYLDVFEVEPLPLDSIYRSLENVYVTPHVAGTFWALTNIFDAILTDLEDAIIKNVTPRYTTGKEVLNSLRDYKD